MTKLSLCATQVRNFPVNWLAAACLRNPCFLQSRTEAVVFKTEDYDGAIAAYKPFVALTIGIKYVIRLYQEDLKNMYKDIASLSYLKLSIKEDYLANQLIIKLDKGGETKKIHAATAEEALTAIGIIKCLSLTPFAVSVEGKFDITDTPAPVDIDKVIGRVIQYLEPLLNQN